MGCASSLPSTWIDVCDGSHTAPEKQVSIQKLYYFEDFWGRKSALEFMMDYKGIPFEVQGINAVAYYTMGIKKKLGGLPVCERADGRLMNETQPIARYIARHNGLYPANPLEAYWNDRIALAYEPIIDGTFKWILAMGGEKKTLYDKIHTETLPTCLKAVAEHFREGKWMIGDGSKIYMCDFFWGRVYTDVMANPRSFIEQAHRQNILKACPGFKSFGEKFMQENQNWLKKREVLGQKYCC